MKQNFEGAVEVKEWRQLQEKYAGVIHICTPTNMDVVSPSQTSQTEKSTKPKTTSDKKKELDKSEKLKKAKKVKKAKRSNINN